MYYFNKLKNKMSTTYNTWKQKQLVSKESFQWLYLIRLIEKIFHFYSSLSTTYPMTHQALKEAAAH